MNSISNRNKVFRIVIGVVILITCVVIGMATTVVIQASGGSPLPDYISKDTSKTLGTSENPYTILEIVPDVNSATVGYLINGSEPRNLLSIGATNKDVATSAAGIYAGAFASASSPSSTIGNYTDNYIFDSDKASIGAVPAGGFTGIQDTYQDEQNPGNAYSQFGYFTNVGAGKGSYNFDANKQCFVPVNGGKFTWTCVGEFQHVGAGNIPEGSMPCTRMIDYGQGGEREFSYNATTSKGAVGEKAYRYYYSPTGGFKWVPNNNYNNEDIFRENATAEEIQASSVGAKLYMTRTEDKYYSYKASAITVNDLLLKELIGHTDNYIYNSDKASIGAVPTGGFTEILDTYQDEHNPGNAYSQFGYFTNVGAGKGSYNFDANKQCFVPVNGGKFTWTCVGEFQHVGAGNIPEGSMPCTRMIDYGQGGEREFSYNATTSKGAVGEKAYRYYYSPTGGFKWVPNNNYNNEDIFRENATAEEIQASSVGTKLYMTRTEDKYYSYQASAINYKTQVVTVTPAQLVVDDGNAYEANKAKNLIDTADAITIHDCSTGYRIAKALDDPTTPVNDGPKFKNVNNGSKDLTLKTVNYMIQRGAGATPAAIMFDEDAIKTANSYGAGNGDCPNLKLLYDVYNNLGAKLAYNWMSGQQYSAKVNAASGQAGYRNFSYDEVDALGKSQFVYNFKGGDDSWLTSAFADESKIVKSALNEPAFYNVNVDSSMSVAKMFTAINKESKAYNQPRKLTILEVQPNEKFYYDPNNRDSWIKYYLDLFPWFIGTGTDVTADITVKTMPTYEFVGKNEDVNENYDMVLIGNKEQDETNGKYGYNDPMLQTPLPRELGGDGVTPCPVSYSSVGDLITTYGYHKYPVDEAYEAIMEDWDNTENYNSWTGARTNTDEVEPEPDSSSSRYSYKWKYGLFRDNTWYNTKNVKALRDKTYNIGFSRNFIREIVGGGDADDYRGLAWWYQKTRNPVYGTKHGSDANMVGLRYSGNDLTKKKYDQLLDFSTQAPLIVADDLYWQYPGLSEYVSAYKIDKSSFIYKLANMNVQEKSTVHKYINGVDVNKKANKVKSEMISDNLSATFTNTVGNMPGLPVEYNNNNSNNQMDSAGNNVLQYHFVLNGNDRSTYGVNLYTDSNGNGIFEGCINHEKERIATGDTKSYDSEKSNNLIIFDETSKANVTDGVLYNGHTYLVTRILPPSDVGLIPWKLEIYKQGNDSIRFSQIGYTRIPAKERTVINVLQMNPNPNMSGNGFDDLSVCFANHYRFKLDNWYGNITPNATFINNQEMSNLYSEQYVKDFNIQVDFMDNDYWKQVYGNNRDEWASALMKYDMIIIGFQDMAKFTNNENYIYGFEKFREAGKSVILSHDLCEDASMGIMDMTDNSNTDSIIQSDVRYYLRDISGQLRKYYKADSDEEHKNDYSYLDYSLRGDNLTFEPSDIFKIFTSIREYKAVGAGDTNVDYFMQNKDNKANTPIYDKHTYTYGVFGDSNYTYDNNQEIWLNTPINVIREYYDKKDGVLDGKYTNKPAGIIQDNSTRSMLYYSTINYDRNNNSFLDKLDRAVNLNRKDLVWQTSTFETYKVQSVNEGQITKYPYAIPKTLDVAQTHTQNYQLDLEYDEEGDVLIWYNLAGGRMYQGRNQDCRNNYYIYTKGNITYTGVGHSGGLTENEKKLFVNTMVASYRSSASDPYITITNQDAVRNGKTTTIYLEDRGDGGNNIDINYRINDDTTNSKINRKYLVHIYKDGDWQGMIEDAEKAKDYKIENVSYSEVKANGQVQYQILLVSSYINDQGVEVLTSDIQTVNVVLMPMFGLR